MNNLERIEKCLEETKGFTAEEIIAYSFREFGHKIVFASSLGEEDQVITDMIAHHAPEIEVFTLDTGRLFPETYELLAKTQKRYPALNLKIFYPDTRAAEDMVKARGINLFYESVENRKMCCNVRKVEPLHRALEHRDSWMTGLRRAQSVTRTDVKSFEWDSANERIKVNPLVDWSLLQVHKYIKEQNIDINPLHQSGFISIGCAPCTRAVQQGEDIRAGRWWWENPEQKECGLHNNPKRKHQ